MPSFKFVPFRGLPDYPDDEMARRAEACHEKFDRHFSDREVPRAVIESCLRAAGTAPSGAHRQPWHFVAVRNPEIKRSIRKAAEREEREFYGGRAPEDWLDALAPFGTDEFKPFLETAPWLLVIFAQLHGVEGDGTKVKHYYVNESVGIATGLLITALHEAGLATLTHTPSPMRFLNEILERPKNERPFLILVVGHPAEDTRVPDLTRKPLKDISTFRD